MLSNKKPIIEEKIKFRIPEESNFPNTILIDTVSYCNLKCSMCPHKNMSRNPGIMPWDLYKKIIDEIAEKKPDARIWITFFGEGMILKDLPEKIAYAKERGLTDIVLNSNGNLFTTEMSKRLIESGLDGLYVGIDAFTQPTYEKLRVGGNIEKARSGVLEYKELLKQYGKPEQYVIVQYVEMEENIHELQAFLDFWNSHDIKVKIRPMVSWAGKANAPNLNTDIERLPCFWAMNTLNIADDGRVCLCSVDLECNCPMGNIVVDTIEDVWKSSLLEFRKCHRENRWEELPEMCRNCKDWQSGYAQYV